MASIRTHTQWPSAETSLYDVQVFNDEKLRIERGNFMSTNGSPGKRKRGILLVRLFILILIRRRVSPGGREKRSFLFLF